MDYIREFNKHEAERLKTNAFRVYVQHYRESYRLTLQGEDVATQQYHDAEVERISKVLSEEVRKAIEVIVEWDIADSQPQ